MKKPRRWITAHKTNGRTEWRLTDWGFRRASWIIFLVGAIFFGSSVLYSVVSCADGDCTVSHREQQREQRQQRQQWIEQQQQFLQQQDSVKDYQQQLRDRK